MKMVLKFKLNVRMEKWGDLSDCDVKDPQRVALQAVECLFAKFPVTQFLELYSCLSPVQVHPAPWSGPGILLK